MDISPLSYSCHRRSLGFEVPHIDFICLASAYEGGRWPFLSLIVSSSHQQYTISVLIIAEWARGRKWDRNLEL